MKIKRPSAFTLIELLVVISIIGILASLALPAINSALAKGQMTQTLSNMKQLHLATTQMALDGVTTGDTNYGWPGDIGATWAVWATNLVPSYLNTNDFAKLLSAPGLARPNTTAIGTKAPTAINVYSLSENSGGDNVFLITANWTNGQPLTPQGKPYGDKGFVVFRKGGDGVLLLPKQYNNTNVIGVTTNTLLN